MKRWLVPMLLLAAMAMGEGLFRGTDVAKLEPVELVRLRQTASGIEVQTDTGSFGLGVTVTDAVENMKDTASGEIFLDTAEYVVLTGLDEHILAELMTCFRPSCKILFLAGAARPEELSAFLRSRPQKLTLLDWRLTGRQPPVLISEGGIIRFAE